LGWRYEDHAALSSLVGLWQKTKKLIIKEKKKIQFEAYLINIIIRNNVVE